MSSRSTSTTVQRKTRTYAVQPDYRCISLTYPYAYPDVFLPYMYGLVSYLNG
jgi:hypothetical protein